jgi:valyl-tRNA synthetase
MLEKHYQPADIEQRLYQKWRDMGAFTAGAKADGAGAGAGAAEPFSIVIPPPNVTGSLHIGHALNNTLQDVLTRFQRMRGRETLWQPGMDHAGIATQMVVERQLADDGVYLDRGIDPQGDAANGSRIGRDDFVDKVWQWKAESGGIIFNQLQRLGATCDWSRERFTMDDGLSAAVIKVFVQLHSEGLIYKDKRLVNWDPKFHTAISDLEVDQREIQGHLWHIKYEVDGEPGRTITVATTRPETMLGDTAVAVHADDPRYRDLIGKHAILPLVGRKLPIVADEIADPEEGSGAVKITPAHDFNDFEVGRRHNLEMINIFNADGHLNDAVPEAYQRLERFEARKKVVEDLEALGVLAEIEDRTHSVPYGDRSGVVIEPWLTDQWYVNAEALAQPAIKAVEDGRTRFVPENWSKTYFEWMRNIQPWCISRQLWWGHRIPAWYGPDNQVFVAESEAAARQAAADHYGDTNVVLTQDNDVLDTWFSSALWPFSTMGWPEQTPELSKYYPTATLVTGFDIIFFWVARMMMMGLHFMDEVPFRDVYIHALVRDAKGQKMSKSKGNIIDPLELIDEYGADAVRFTLTAMAAMGRDIKLSTSRVEGYRNFSTKLWNASRLCEMNECKLRDDFDPAACEHTVNRWIVGAAAQAVTQVTEALGGYKFDQAANAAYQFTWHSFCDWYLELIKPIMFGDDAAAIEETRATAAWVLDRVLKLLHPFMPYVTEELWQELGYAAASADGAMLITANWPTADLELADPAAADEMDWVIRLISEVRAIRSELNVPGGQQIPAILVGASPVTCERLATHMDQITRLARLSEISVTEDGGAPLPHGSVQTVLDEASLALPLADVIDLGQEIARLQKEISRLDGEIIGFEKKLANEKFTAKAPAEVVEEQRTRRADASLARDKLIVALERLTAA